MTRLGGLGGLCALLLAGACSSEAVPVNVAPNDPGAPVAPPPLPSDQKAELDKLLGEINSSANMTAADFEDLYKVPFAQGLSYDPATSVGLSTIQGSSLSLNAAELTNLGKNGFVISEAHRFPTFTYGYDSIYSQDLPLFVSADSILYAVHRSYDEILEAIETVSLMKQLDSLLTGMRKGLPGAALVSADAVKDADVFLAVAEGLLTGQPAAPVAGGDAATINELVSGATAQTGMKSVVLFGVSRDVDFSQFKPRGHYTDTPELERYFRAMIWLGRIDFRLLETQPDGSQIFRRRQLEGALTLREAMADKALVDRYTMIDKTIGAFVGESDYMTVPQLSSLLADLGVTKYADLANVPDATIVKAIIDGGYGTQRISSHIMVNGLGGATLPLSSSFALLGQRYVVDSHVFSNVVYDRVQGGKAMRMMPDPLDVAFAALGNNQAASLLQPQIAKWGYAPDLHAMRILVDAHPADFWGENLYNLWLSSLRTLSPSATDLADPKAAGLPSVATTEAWGRRLLNTQLASWAELRHDTILYAKQSYTGGSTCDFPDAYIDPYPGFYDGVASLAAKGADVVKVLDLSADPNLAKAIPEYFDHLHMVALMLKGMAEKERAGVPFTADEMMFINEAVALQLGCGEPFGADGWYPQLFWTNYSSVEFDPTIADVHTQPTDEVGNPVGKVLHVGTGMSRLMVVTVDTCNGPRAYAGLASSYFEQTTENFERLDDETWQAGLFMATPPDVPWMTDLVVR